MTNAESVRQIQKLSPGPNDILVMRFAHENGRPIPFNLPPSVKYAGIVFLQEGEDLSVMTEEDMRAIGWVRADG